jgi:hypothetical protein
MKRHLCTGIATTQKVGNELSKWNMKMTAMNEVKRLKKQLEYEHLQIFKEPVSNST